MNDTELAAEIRIAAKHFGGFRERALISAAQRLEGMEARNAELRDMAEEAVNAWACCASLHREYAREKDALYTTRQADFVRHEKNARAALRAIPAKKVAE